MGFQLPTSTGDFTGFLNHQQYENLGLFFIDGIHPPNERTYPPKQLLLFEKMNQL